jgi:hypothetical protein
MGIAAAASASAEATPAFYVNAETIENQGEPVTYVGLNKITRVPARIEQAGQDYSWGFDGAEMRCRDLGYLFWLLLGLDTFSTTHTLTPVQDSKYANVKVDDSLLKAGASTSTASLTGAKVGRIALELGLKNWAKIAASGIHCTHASPGAALSPTVPTGANHAPLSWVALRTGTGFFKIGYGGGAPASDTAIKGFSMELTQVLEPSGITLGSDQPTGINEGDMGVTFEVMREFEGAAAITEYTAWKTHVAIGIDWKALIGAHEFRMEIPYARISGPYRDNVGAGADSIMASVRCTAIQDGSNPLIRVTVLDDFGAVYS